METTTRHLKNDTLNEGVNRLLQTQRAVVDRTKQAAQATDDYVHDRPWSSIGIAIAAGFILGYFLPRR